MLHRLLGTVAKVAVASLIVGTILAHFGITLDMVMTETGLSPSRIEAILSRAFAWIWPNIALGALVIVPVWFVAAILRPPGPSRE
jgi:hypothetical protein